MTERQTLIEEAISILEQWYWNPKCNLPRWNAACRDFVLLAADPDNLTNLRRFVHDLREDL